jgi:asparagine synthase (glutamine-hydrolysing)
MRLIGRIVPDGTRGRNFLFNISLPLDKRFIDYLSHVSLFRNRRLLSSDLLNSLRAKEDVLGKYFEEARDFDALSRLQYVDMKTYLPGDILVKVDRMSMAHSLETRAPLLDQELMEFVNGIPSRYKLNGRTTKYVFKRLQKFFRKRS